MASPIVLLHAFPLSSRMFEPLRDALPVLDVITPDYPPSSDLDSFADLGVLRLSRQSGVSLIRPDGYIACSGQGRGDLAVLASASELLQRQTA